MKPRDLPPIVLHGVVRLPMSEHDMVDLLRKHGVSVMLGAQYSVRCQFGQIAEVIRDVELASTYGVRAHPTRLGVMLAVSVSDLPDCYEWKHIGESRDYENQYGHIAEVLRPNPSHQPPPVGGRLDGVVGMKG